MTREELIEVMARAMLADELTVRPTLTFDPAWQQESDIWLSNAKAALSALEAAGVRLVPVNEKPGQGWLHEAVKDACLRASKNSGGTPPQLLYAPILWAMQDALAASPYAKDPGNG